jgi:hypothetical protein
MAIYHYKYVLSYKLNMKVSTSQPAIYGFEVSKSLDAISRQWGER